ncbi:hypothetical protein QVD17_06521 [Tagetes erecta]|uniref:Uncharacterized protein n=1 Tax=Tagetes erecta TaxID=13708 RepID=A0AAD8LFR7_TARER|nr:hypothetical protein QVD17_06521 [Tagetes erecta]
MADQKQSNQPQPKPAIPAYVKAKKCRVCKVHTLFFSLLEHTHRQLEHRFPASLRRIGTFISYRKLGVRRQAPMMMMVVMCRLWREGFDLGDFNGGGDDDEEGVYALYWKGFEDYCCFFSYLWLLGLFLRNPSMRRSTGKTNGVFPGKSHRQGAVLKVNQKRPQVHWSDIGAHMEEEEEVQHSNDDEIQQIHNQNETTSNYNTYIHLFTNHCPTIFNFPHKKNSSNNILLLFLHSSLFIVYLFIASDDKRVKSCKSFFSGQWICIFRTTNLNTGLSVYKSLVCKDWCDGDIAVNSTSKKHIKCS